MTLPRYTGKNNLHSKNIIIDYHDYIYIYLGLVGNIFV